MLAITKSKDHNEAQQCRPNLLPCKIHHDGPVDIHERYWKPEDLPNGSQQAYFRGRKLHGRKVDFPQGYEGKILRITDERIEQPASNQPSLQPSDVEDDEDAMEDEDDPVEVKAVRTIATFDGFTTWGHEVLPNAADDPYIKGVEEWVKLAEAIHSRPKSEPEARTS